LIRLRLLDDPTPSRSPRRHTVTAPGLIELQDDLSDALRTRVRITMGARKGKLAIDFDSVDDLERLVAVIASGLEQSAPATDR
jgi:ParB family transcriptional regulator, chromosome partitioning protein